MASERAHGSQCAQRGRRSYDESHLRASSAGCDLSGICRFRLHWRLRGPVEEATEEDILCPELGLLLQSRKWTAGIGFAQLDVPARQAARSAFLFALKSCLSEFGGLKPRQAKRLSITLNSLGTYCARERTRTSTPLREPAPEAGASANSATRARARQNEAFNCARRIGLCQRAASRVIMEMIPPSNSADSERQDAAPLPFTAARAANAPEQFRIGEVPRKGPLTRIRLRPYGRGTIRAA